MNVALTVPLILTNSLNHTQDKLRKKLGNCPKIKTHLYKIEETADKSQQPLSKKTN